MIGKTIAGKYKILEQIGSGGMGVVYKAQQLSVDRIVAIKVLHPKLSLGINEELFLARFRREAQTASKIRHPNAVTIHDYGQEDAIPYIVMEFIEGTRLSDELENNEILPLTRSLDIFGQICEAVAAAHSLDIVHRDLKPENIMIRNLHDNSEHVVVLDFGIAKVIGDEDAPISSITSTGVVVGSPHYMAPEQVRGKKLDSRTDIYSLGVILYQLLSGKRPFTASSAADTMLKHISEPPTPFKKSASEVEIPKKVQKLVLQALEKDPKKRPQTVRELSSSLKEAFSESSTSKPPTPKKKSEIKKPLFLVLALAALLILYTLIPETTENQKESDLITVTTTSTSTTTSSTTTTSSSTTTTTTIPPPPIQHSVSTTIDAGDLAKEGLQLYELGHYGRAETKFKSALSQDPDNAFFRHALGTSYLKQNRFNEAIAELRKSEKLDSENADTLNNLAEAYLGIRNRKAIDYYKKAVKLSPNEPEYRNNLGFCYFQFSQKDESLKVHREVVKRHPSYAPGQFGLAYVLIDKQDYQQAIVYLEKAVQLAPSNTDYRNTLNKLKKHMADNK